MTKVRLLVWSPRAREDLKDVWRYYARVASAEVADRIVYDMTQHAARLERNPLPGRERDELRPGLRSLLAHPYTIFYRVEGDRAEVARVLHERRDFHAGLDEDSD